MSREFRTNYSQGYVVEFVDKEPCQSWMLLPAENLWPVALRGVLYFLALMYIFLGIAITSDVFICSIEVITSKKRKVVRWDEERQEKVEREVLLWNETVANLTLMALGSSAPEILLSTGEMVSNISDRKAEDALGTFAIIGSAAFNLLIISAICVMSVPTGTVKSIKELGVFMVTSAWSIWAYVWMLLVVKYISPGQIDPWEAWMTLGYMPLFVGMAYATDKGLFGNKRKVGLEETAGDGDEEDDVAVRMVEHQHQHFTRTVPKQLRVLEAEKAQRISIASIERQDETGPITSPTETTIGSSRYSLRSRRRTQTSYTPFSPWRRNSDQISLLSSPGYVGGGLETIQEKVTGFKHRMSEAMPPKKPMALFRQPSSVSSRASFRHRAMSTMVGSQAFHRLENQGPRMVDMIGKVRIISEAIEKGTSDDVVKSMLQTNSIAPFDCSEIPRDTTRDVAGDLLGKFTFASDRFAVLANAGFLEIDIIYHRQMPNLNLATKEACVDETQPSQERKPSAEAEGQQPEGYQSGWVSVDYETREGSAKPGKDYILTQGNMTFEESDSDKLLKVPIVQGKEPGANVDFYILLKNPSEGGGLGDPSITRITIMDDNEPGEFLFEEQDYYASLKSGEVMVRVIREHGFNGDVTLEYSTIDGTAVGGEEITTGVDYIESHGSLHFEHGETSKPITVQINASAEVSSNFIITIRNPSNGARIGVCSAVVVHINKAGPTSTFDELMERVEDLLDDEVEEKHITWSGQFAQAMSLEPGKDDEGNVLPLKWNHYVMHFLTFFWKVSCAIIPPTSILGAWPSFLASLLFLGMMIALMEQMGKLLGCVVGLQTSVAGITIIALGTSLPETFASRTAAVQDENADAAIGNITGSNTVNVFLGLGLPWVLKTTHALIYGYTFKVKTDNLTQSVLLFGTAGCICLATIMIRRKVCGGELGGSFWSKWLMVCLNTTMWVSYVVVICLHAYGKIRIAEF